LPRLSSLSFIFTVFFLIFLSSFLATLFLFEYLQKYDYLVPSFSLPVCLKIRLYVLLKFSLRKEVQTNIYRKIVFS
jgi:hypothetical protein